MKLLVTGGAGFMGSAFVRYWLQNHKQDQIVNLDKLTYAGHLENLKEVEENPNYRFIKGDIGDLSIVKVAMQNVDVVIHFAAESHVDRSIVDPLIFIKSNVEGTGVLLNIALDKKIKRFHHVSTDEVYGELGPNDPPFTEETPYSPRTPYSASKAGSDHLVKAYFATYGLPITITNSANNFGIYHDPEKLIPRFITNLLEGKKIPLMGMGENIRQWVNAFDHARAVEAVLLNGKVGETYCISGEELKNIEVTKMILEFLEKDESQIEYIPDRLGHDFRYALDSTKLESLGWKPLKSFKEWLKETIEWYKDNQWWWKPLKTGRPDVDPNTQRQILK